MSTGDFDADAWIRSGSRSYSGILGRCLEGGRGLLSWAFANSCLLCDSPVRSNADESAGVSPVCEVCIRDLPALPPVCPRCAAPSPSGAICGACIAHTPSFDRTVAVWRYTFPLDRLVLALKFHARLSLAPFLAGRLAGRIRESAATVTPDLLLPMPLHRKRLAERGFNQSMEIARPLARMLGCRVQTGGVMRIRPTVPQTELDPQSRRKNVRGAFRCNLDLTGKRVAVVDDVMTTGATLEELTGVLKRAGAAEVINLVIARAYPD